MKTDEKKIEPLDRSLKVTVLPAVAVKIALGGRLSRDGDRAAVTFEGEASIMHLADFEIASKAAKRLVPHMRGRKGVSAVLDAMDLARRYVVEEIFSPGLLRVIFYPSVVDASAYYRCILPSVAANAGTRVHADVSRVHSVREALDYDVVVLQLDHTSQTLSFALTLRDMGKKIVFELDDAFDALELWHDRHDTYAVPEVRDRMWKMLAMADAVTVTTKHLKARYADRARRVAVIPNFVVPGDYPKPDPHGTGEFRILWAGSPSHWGDLEMVAATLVRFASKYPETRLVFFGRKPPPMEVPDWIVRHVPFVPYRDYPATLAGVAADVAIAPLADVPFNHGKSACKLLEYGACGYPIIASDVPPYRDALGAGCHYGLLAKTEDWMGALEFVHNDADLRARLSARAKELAQASDIARHVGEIEAFYLSLK